MLIILKLLIILSFFGYAMFTFWVLHIGMPLHEAFAQVEHQPNIYDVVHVKYLDEVGVLSTCELFFASFHFY